MQEEAYLSNDETYSIFKYNDYVIRFLAPYSLERYTKIKEWDNGYLVDIGKTILSKTLIEMWGIVWHNRT